MPAWTVSVVAIRNVGPSVFAIELDAPPDFVALPGQFVLVRESIEKESIGRHYTISSPNTTESFELTIDTNHNGTLSRWLTTRKPGDEIRIEGPFGRIGYAGDGPVVSVGDGPGIGAAVAIGERGIAHGHDVTLVGHGTLAHAPRLSRLSHSGADVFIVTVRLAATIEAVIDRGEVFVFGFRDFLNDVRAALEAIGVDPDVAAYENYGPRP